MKKNIIFLITMCFAFFTSSNIFARAERYIQNDSIAILKKATKSTDKVIKDSQKQNMDAQIKAEKEIRKKVAKEQKKADIQVAKKREKIQNSVYNKMDKKRIKAQQDADKKIKDIQEKVLQDAGKAQTE